MTIFTDEFGEEHEKPKEITPKWRVSGYAILRSDKGNILLVRPSWDVSKWQLPGGAIEIGELISEGIIRECHEETGYTIEVDACPFSAGERNFYCKTEDTFFQSLFLIYHGTLASERRNQEEILKDEIVACEWVSPELLNESNVHPIFWPTIQKIL